MKRAKYPPKRRIARRRSPRDRSGAAVVEFAIIANLLFVMVFSCMEFSRLNLVRNLSQDAAYFAAREAMVPGATEAEAIAEADRILGTVLTNGYTVDVSPLSEESNQITVTVEVEFSEVALFAPMFLPQSRISTTATMATERYDGFFQQ
ncbi:TadE/TadG family type IV pilus assembly protein [Planctomycetaceae bacterium SH139]